MSTKERSAQSVHARAWAILKTPLSLPAWIHRPSGIVWREVRAAFPSVAALAGFIGLLVLVRELGVILKESGYIFTIDISDENLVHTAELVGMIVLLILGVLGGAEEEENGTADFLRRLPIPRLRILAEKILGAAIGFGLWCVLIVLLTEIVWASFGGEPIYKSQVLIGHTGNEPEKLRFLLAAAPLVYLAGLAAGAWIGRVMIAAIVGGLGAIIYICLANWFSKCLTTGGLFQIQNTPVGSYLAGALALFIAAAIRFQTREGR
jgi:hypothetical protein